ncbi:hypothetical protein [Portibacter lacus]|uniref:Uncharacterized protein n=1 Tax=Portibacter lacus TaxID=1099794 RepID=A0AA37SPG6_9BACT|nr:hypothetical protein [Portibacter lacus]GLR17359.1 hypothetical protein GCM10007940_19740 [Portibacter lacus]
MKNLINYFVLIVLITACSASEKMPVVMVSETAGLDRSLEYVNSTISLGRALAEDERLIAIDTEGGTEILVDDVHLEEIENRFEYTIVFPIAIAANQSKTFTIKIQENNNPASSAQQMLSKDDLAVENEFYKATFSSEDDQRGGQVNGIVLKNFKNQLLKRGHISMHWAPNFSKSSSESYFNFEDLRPDANHEIVGEQYSVIKERSGNTDSVPEIQISGRYEFYDKLPYFLFESTILVQKEVELNLLRNDEMTMDSLFTHIAYVKEDGTIEHLNLYSEEVDVLEENHVTDDAPWLAFYHLDKGYGFGSIRLVYDNTNTKGEPSPTHHPYTKITKSSNNGRYWNRVLSDTIQTFPAGSQYYEKNAYLVFPVSPDSPEKVIKDYAALLNNPLTVKVVEN